MVSDNGDSGNGAGICLCNIGLTALMFQIEKNVTDINARLIVLEELARNYLSD